MATAIEYGLIAAGISLAIIGVTQVIDIGPKKWDENFGRKKAAEACTTRPGDTVIVEGWLGRNVVYKCSDWPRIFNPTFVGFR